MNKTQKAEKAYKLYDEIRQAKISDTARYLRMGKMFKGFRDKDKYKDLGYESFSEFNSDPEMGFNPKAVDTCIKVYEKYILHLDVPADVLCSIGHRRLQLILPLMVNEDETSGMWLERADTWSYADLINAVRKEKGRDSMPKTSFHNVVPTSYIKYVESCPCLLCGTTPSVKAHFPRTTGAGAEKWKVLPLCAMCHHEIHAIGVDSFFSLNKIKITDFYYNLISSLYMELNCASKK